MNKTTRKSFLAAVLSVAFAGAALATAAPASAASDADRARDLLAPTLAAVNTSQSAYYDTWRRYEGAGSVKPGIGDEYIVLGQGKGDLKSSPYEYSYKYWKTFDAKRPAEVHTQGRAEDPRLGGSWMRRGDMRGFLPTTVSRLDPSTVVSELQNDRRLGAQVNEISGMTPQQKATSIVDLATAYPVKEGTFQVGSSSTSQMTYVAWNTTAYTSAAGDSCADGRVEASFYALPGGRNMLNSADVFSGQCTTPSGTPVTSFHDIQMRPWDALVGAAPINSVPLNR
jgi:hypothetical protein